MTVPSAPRRGFWYQVSRPFRATGRGIVRALDALEIVSLFVNIGRGIVWIVRGAGKLLVFVFDR